MAIKHDTIDAYIAALPADTGARVEDIRQMIRRTAPQSVEAIKYNMPAFMIGVEYLLCLGAWKTHIGLYPVHRGDEAFERLIAPYRTARNTVRLPHAKPLPHDLVKAILIMRLRELTP